MHPLRWWRPTRFVCLGRLLRALCLGSLGCAVILWPFPLAWGDPTGQMTPAHSLAAGHEAYQHGDFEAAAARWQAAAHGYARARQPQAHSVALTHLARAYEALGHYRQVQENLRLALQAAEQAEDRGQQAIVLGQFGNIAVATGQFTNAETFLQAAHTLAAARGDTTLIAVLWHTRANLLMAQQKPHEALSLYQDSAGLALQAQQPGMAARALAHAALAAERAAQWPRARVFLDEAMTHLKGLQPAHDTAYELLLIGRTYHRLAATDPLLLLRAAEALQAAATMAQEVKDQRALAYAWGYLGRLYEAERRYPEALDLTRRAVMAAQQVHMPEALYLWQWQSGRLLRLLGDTPAALAAYGRAVDTAQSVRTALLHKPDSGESFRTAVGALYFELVALLLQQATALEQGQQAAIYPQHAFYLHQARLTVELFKKEELREYFGDACVAAAQPNTALLDRLAPDTVVLYPILLPDRTELLISLPTGLKRLTVPVTGAELEQQVRVFLDALADRDPLRYLRHARRLYALLLQPLEADLAAQPVQTLVMVPDGILRALPLAALHDGRQFLIEKYALAVTPGIILTDPRPLSRANVQMLAAGTAEATEEFAPLARVPEELQVLQRLYPGTLLLNQDFSAERLDQTMRRGRFGMVHIASHGRFTPDATQSFLLTGQGKLTITRLAEMIGRLRFREQPIELLTLSACETARGDDRAALGLAGVAIQAGARSALATLWLVDDEAAAVAMEAFYRHLQTPGTSRARALQQAQMTLLKDPKYAEPFFWAPFVLLNNWL